MSLTQFAITKARPREKAYKLTDAGGLHLLVRANGSKLWRFRYRFAGTENLLALGSFPEVTLSQARQRREDARRLLAQGIDPSQQRKSDKLAAAMAARNTFGAVAREIIAKLEAEGAAATTVDKNRWLLEDLARPLAGRPISEITPAEILDLLKRIEKTGRRETARRLRGAIGGVFRFAIVTLRATTDPTFALRGALLRPKVQHRPALVDEREFGVLLRAIDEYDGWPTLKAALQLLALTMTRPGDIRHMERSEIDLDQAVWSIPAERMKMRRPHDVPLSKQALTILRNIWSLFDGPLVLPAIRSQERPLSASAMNSALRRLGYAKDEVTAHGFRSSASTILNERGFDPEVIEAALAHQDEDDVRRAYNRATYWPQRVKLMQSWADLLDQFKTMPIGGRSAA